MEYFRTAWAREEEASGDGEEDRLSRRVGRRPKEGARKRSGLVSFSPYPPPALSGSVDPAVDPTSPVPVPVPVPAPAPAVSELATMTDDVMERKRARAFLLLISALRCFIQPSL